MIGLYLMTEKGRRVLSALLENHQEVIAWVVTNPDDSLEDDGFTDIKALCAQHKVECYSRSDMSKQEVQYSLAISWRWIIPESSSKLIVIHDSLLPKYRGFNPLVTSLINGDKEIGATALWASREFDRGEVIFQKSVSVDYPLKIADAISSIADIYVHLASELFDHIARGEVLPCVDQDESLASYSLWRDAEDYFLDWSLSSARLQRQVNAQGYPYAGSACLIGERVVRIGAVKLREDVDISNRQCGKVIFLEDGVPSVVCGQGLLKITEASYEDSGESLIPLKRFRTRFR